MIPAAPDLDYRRSLQEVLGDAARAAPIAERQQRTVSALLRRLYDPIEAQRREMVLLADEVGLGKTFVALGVAWSVLRARAAHPLAAGPVLIVTPESRALYDKWQKEVQAFKDHVLPKDAALEWQAVEKPNQLAEALRKRDNRIVIARMSAFSGQISHFTPARLAVLHTLFGEPEFQLDLDQRLALLHDWGKVDQEQVGRDELDLRRSGAVWAESERLLHFHDGHVRGALARLRECDPWLVQRLADRFDGVRRGQPRRGGFWEDLRELVRATLGQSVPHPLPLVIVDEIHNWKNKTQSWWRFRHTLGGRVDRLLGLSATPFQLGPDELLNVLERRQCLRLDPARALALDRHATELRRALDAAKARGDALREAWAELDDPDGAAAAAAWTDPSASPAALPPRTRRAVAAAREVHAANRALEAELCPFLVRHRRTTTHRAWWVGRDAAPGTDTPTARGAAVRWQPGLDARGDAELVHYLMMRGVETHDARGRSSLGADLGGSYKFFADHALPRLRAGANPTAAGYFDLVAQAVSGAAQGHPKVDVTADRAFRYWLRGEKTLIFCFNVLTVDAVVDAVRARIKAHQEATLARHFDSARSAGTRTFENFRARIYDHRQSLFLLFQDYPLAGPAGRLHPSLALRPSDLPALAHRLAHHGAPGDRGRFSRRLVIACAEQLLMARWRAESGAAAHLRALVETWRPDAATCVSDAWPKTRALEVEGQHREYEADLGEDDEDTGARDRAEERWAAVLDGRAARDSLAPYLGDAPDGSLLLTHHRAALWRLGAKPRALAARVLRSWLRSPGFLARFVFDGDAGPGIADDSDEPWARVFRDRYTQASPGGESARQRFDAFLDTLEKAARSQTTLEAYEASSGKRDVVVKADGSVGPILRLHHFTGFNTPLFPEVLVATSVGQEGIDLHRECRHVIHHDLPWNPATLEQRTGRVDRIGSKAERLAAVPGADPRLDVVVPYVAGTYDEHRFRVVHGRAQLFEVTMGGDFAVDGHRRADDAMELEELGDDDEGAEGAAYAELPPVIAEALRLRLEAT